MAGYLPTFLFLGGGGREGGLDGDRAKVDKYQIKRSWPISSHLDLTSLGIKGFIV